MKIYTSRHISFFTTALFFYSHLSLPQHFLSTWLLWLTFNQFFFFLNHLIHIMRICNPKMMFPYRLSTLCETPANHADSFILLNPIKICSNKLDCSGQRFYCQKASFNCSISILYCKKTFYNLKSIFCKNI